MHDIIFLTVKYIISYMRVPYRFTCVRFEDVIATVMKNSIVFSGH
jgi:hypothetical protein